MITHDHQLIFVHIPKCAGRSVCDVFNQRFDHYTARFYKKEYSKFWNEYHKMTIVRHPLDRLVSLYIYVKSHRRHAHEIIAANIDDFNQWLQSNIQAWHTTHLPIYDSAEGWRGTDGDIGSTFWFESQWQRITTVDGCEIENVFRLEEGMHRVNEFLSELTGTKVTTPHLNKSEYINWQSYYNKETYDLATSWAPVVEDAVELNYAL